MNASDLKDGFLPLILEYLPDTGTPERKAFNSAFWSKCQEMHRKYGKDKGGGATVSDALQKFLDNPMTPEEESKHLRALLHAGLETGDINPQLLDKLDKIIGVHSEVDEKLEFISWKDAFPDLKTAIDICSRPQPRDCE